MKNLSDQERKKISKNLHNCAIIVMLIALLIPEQGSLVKEVIMMGAMTLLITSYPVKYWESDRAYSIITLVSIPISWYVTMFEGNLIYLGIWAFAMMFLFFYKSQ